jgi:small subunit ribosomal protein S7
MSRRKAAPKRFVMPDPLFKSQLLAKFINSVMRDGKKSVAENIVYGALDEALSKYMKSGKSNTKSGKDSSEFSIKHVSGDIRSSAEAREEALKLFREALDKVTPTVEVRSRRVGGSTYQVPMEIRPERRMALAMRWLSDFASKRNEKTMALRLANEMLDALEDRGAAVKKREDVHRMAKANQAFAHYRW